MTKRRPFLWWKLTPTQIALIERLAAAGGTLPYDKLKYVDLVAFDELRRLKLADMGMKGRVKLVAVLTDKGRALRENAYRTEQVVVRVTEPQIALLRHLDDGSAEITFAYAHGDEAILEGVRATSSTPR